VIQPSSTEAVQREDSKELKLPDIRQMMREMDERLLHKKIFQPLQYIEMDITTGYQKYYNDFFTEEQPGLDKKPPEKKQEAAPRFSSTIKPKKSVHMDPVLEHISGGDPSVIDKMRFISKKELAKHRALARDRDFKRFEDIDLKNENEISLKDIASDDEYKYSSEEPTPISKNEEEEDDEGIENLYQFWEEQDKKKLAFLKERNPNIDVRLEEYLMSHSQ
jgi:hypothetical protein